MKSYFLAAVALATLTACSGEAGGAGGAQTYKMTAGEVRGHLVNRGYPAGSLEGAEDRTVEAREMDDDHVQWFIHNGSGTGYLCHTVIEPANADGSETRLANTCETPAHAEKKVAALTKMIDSILTADRDDPFAKK